MNESGLERAKKKALRYLEFRDRTVAEMETYLANKGFSEEVVHEVTSWLRDLNYLDDDRFASAYIESRLRSKPMGKTRLRYELYRKGLDSVTIDEHLQDLSPERELEAARRLVRTRLAKEPADPASTARKLRSLLLRRGFSYEAVQQVLEEALGNQEFRTDRK